VACALLHIERAQRLETKRGGKNAESQISLTSDGYFLQLGCRALGLFVRYEFDRVINRLVVANRDHQREWLGNRFGLGHGFWICFRQPFRNKHWLGYQLRYFHEERHQQLRQH